MQLTEVEALNCVGGMWRAGGSSETFDVFDPATYETLASYPLAGAEDVRAVVEAAKAAFPEWRRTMPA